jgi:predicted DNA-binding protein
MSWKSLSALMGSNRKDRDSVEQVKQQEITKLIRVFESRVTTNGATMIPPELAERLENLVSAVQVFVKRDVVLTGLSRILEICERSPGQIVPELKLGAFKSRGQTSIGFRVPLDLDDRLTKLVSSRPGLSKRDVVMAGLDLILSECEKVNGGLFASPETRVPET